MKKLIKSKKNALGHVEFIISFALFIFFISALFILLNPFKKTPSNILVDTLYLNLEDNLTTSFSSLSIRINPDIIEDGKTCFQMPKIIDLNCTGGRNLLVFNSTSDRLSSKFDNNNYYFENKASDNYFTFRCSDELILVNDNLEDCQSLSIDQGDYELGIITTRMLWSNKKLQSFKESYYSDYQTVSKKIISGNDFGFIINEFDAEKKVLYNVSNTRPKGLNVYAKTLPIDILDQDSKITKSTIFVFTW